MIVDIGDEIVELLNKNNGKWEMTTMRDVVFLRNVYGEKFVFSRYIEGSLDGGVTWKTMYESELNLIGAYVCKSIKWRVKE